MILEIDGWKFQIFDVTTRKYYAREVAGHCTCATCRNFYQTVDNVCPELRPFLARFGVHVEAPDSMSAPIQTICDCYYAVCGKILEAGEEPIFIGNTVVYPQTCEEAMVDTDMDEPYFFLYISPLNVPWVLEEPMETIDTPEKEQQVISKILGKWIK